MSWSAVLLLGWARKGFSWEVNKEGAMGVCLLVGVTGFSLSAKADAITGRIQSQWRI
jgi:hypothetical protein